IMTVCIAGEAICALALILFTLSETQSVVPVFVTLVVFGTLRAFFGPAQQSLLPTLVPDRDLANAIAWSTASWQIATVLGPVAGGLLYGLSANTAYGAAFVMLTAATLLAAFVPTPPQASAREKPSFETLVAGFRYIWSE